MKPNIKDRQVKTAFLIQGVTISHKVTTSLNVTRNEVEMYTTPIGLHVIHKAGEFLVPYSNMVFCEYISEPEVKI